MRPKTARLVANNVDPDQTPHYAASDLGLHCLPRPVCPNAYGKYGNVKFSGFRVSHYYFIKQTLQGIVFIALQIFLQMLC